MRELRSALSEMRLADLAVGSDGRNRTILSAFRSRTGRCQPSNTKYIFGPSVWLRNLIRPPEGCGIAYIDWCQQEHGIAAALSGDSAMQAAYLSGDPYLEFAKQAGAVPADATKHSHGPTRELFKQCALAVAYGMEAEGWRGGLGSRRSSPAIFCGPTAKLIGRFWAWSDAAVDTRDADRLAQDRVRLAGPHWRQSQSSVAAKFPVPGQRRRNAAPGRLLRHRTGH